VRRRIESRSPSGDGDGDGDLELFLIIIIEEPRLVGARGGGVAAVWGQGRERVTLVAVVAAAAAEEEEEEGPATIGEDETRLYPAMSRAPAAGRITGGASGKGFHGESEPNRVRYMDQASWATKRAVRGSRVRMKVFWVDTRSSQYRGTRGRLETRFQKT